MPTLMPPPLPIYALRLRGRLLSLERPRVMGIINLTPDSFFGLSRQQTVEAALAQAYRMAEEGAEMLDLGAVSTRPGAGEVAEREELARLLPALEEIRKALPEMPLSIDTFRATVAWRALAAGADIINDVSGGADPDMMPTAAQAGAAYVCMHTRGTPQTMAGLAEYDDLLPALQDFFLERMEAARAAGLGDVILDPGLGFAKTPAHSFEVLANLPRLHLLGRPLLIGLSRKGLVWKTLGTTPEQALNGTTALHMAALLGGAQILRVHDVKEAMEAVWLFKNLTNLS